MLCLKISAVLTTDQLVLLHGGAATRDHLHERLVNGLMRKAATLGGRSLLLPLRSIIDINRLMTESRIVPHELRVLRILLPHRAIIKAVLALAVWIVSVAILAGALI